MVKWIPGTGNITSYGGSLVDMYVPSSTSKVQGTDEPTGGAVGIATLNDSAEMFARIANNITYISNGIIYEDTTLTITDAASIVAANTYLSNVNTVIGGATLKIDFVATANAVTGVGLLIEGISGGGTIEIDLNDDVFTCDTGLDTQSAIEISDCNCPFVRIHGSNFSGCGIVTNEDGHSCIKCTRVSGNVYIHALDNIEGTETNHPLLHFVDCNNVFLVNPVLEGGSGSYGIKAQNSKVLVYQTATFTTIGTAFAALDGSIITAAQASFGAAPSTTYVKKSDDSIFQYDPGTSSLTPGTVLELKSLAAMLKNSPLYRNLTITIDNASYDVGSAAISFTDIFGSGSLTFTAETPLTMAGTGQSVDFYNDAAANINVWEFKNVSVPINVDSIKFHQKHPTGQVFGMYVENCLSNNDFRYNWFKCEAGTSNQNFHCVNSNGTLAENEFDGGVYAISANYNSHIVSYNNDTNATSSTYGLGAYNNSAIGQGGTDQPSGSSDATDTDVGGVVR